MSNAADRPQPRARALLRTCAECGTRYPASRSRCPHCGHLHLRGRSEAETLAEGSLTGALQVIARMGPGAGGWLLGFGLVLAAIHAAVFDAVDWPALVIAGFGALLLLPVRLFDRGPPAPAWDDADPSGSAARAGHHELREARRRDLRNGMIVILVLVAIYSINSRIGAGGEGVEPQGGERTPPAEAERVPNPER